MDKLARFTIQHVRVVAFLTIAALVWGLYAYAVQPRQEDPEITIRSAQVVATFPGLSPERMEQLITRPIEEKLKELPEVDEIQSVSMTGITIVTPSVHPRYADMEPIWTDVRNKMDDLRAMLPEGTQGPTVNDDYGRVAVVTLALSGEDYSMAELYEVARTVRDTLNALPLVARTDLYGVQEQRIWIEFTPDTMAQFDLTPSAIVAALRGQNIVLPGGSVNADGQSVTIEPSGDFRSVEEIRNLAIETQGGGLVYLRDLAKVRRAYSEPPEAPVFYNNRPAIVLGVSMIPASNVVELGRQVTTQVEALRTRLPLGMQLDIAIFQPAQVQAAVSAATTNLLQTMAVVLVVVMLFLGWRMGLIVGAMVPLTMLLTLIGMSIWGIEMHRVSIAAIIVALGLLVDNGVVIAEDIQRRMDAGATRLDAALGAPGSLAMPLLTSSLTTIMAFMPLVLIADHTGEFLRSLGQVLSLALLTSWLLSISMAPALCYWFLAAGHTSAPAPPRRAPWRYYRAFLGWALSRRALVLALSLCLLYAAAWSFGFVRQRSLGPSERNQFTAYIDLPAEAHVSATISAARTLVAYLADRQHNPEVTDTLLYVGGGGPRFFLALAPNDSQPNKAFLVVNTRTHAELAAVMARTEAFIQQQLPEATGRTEILSLGLAALGTVQVRLYGPELHRLRALGVQVRDIFHSVPGTTAVRNDWENPVLKLRVEIDQERARRAGVSSEEVARTLSAYFDGETITLYREGDQVIPVMIRARAEARTSLDRLRTVEIYSQSRGVVVPLLQIADFAGDVEPSQIRRHNQQRALTVSGKHPQLTSLELYARMQQALAALQLPPGYRLQMEGEIKSAQESNGKLLAFAPHALSVIFLLLLLQFNSFRRVAIILLTIPLVVIGANFGLVALRAYFDFTAMLGFFSLAGIIVNNGIVLIDRIDRLRVEGMAVDAAVVAAALSRARPILMTTLTTIVGLLPLALFGGEFWYGMAIVIMCGLGMGTLLTLGLVPVLYSLMFRPVVRRAVADGSG